MKGKIEMEEVRKDYEELLNAIVQQAAFDYLSIKTKMWRLENGLYRGKRNKNDYRRLLDKKLKELTDFFKSSYYEIICNIDGDYMIRKLNEKFENEILPDMMKNHKRQFSKPKKGEL